MFYAQFVLSKKGPLAKIWLAAHWEKKLTKAQVFETDIASAADAVSHPKVKMALRTTGHLLLGLVRIYSRKAKYLLADCNEAFLKIKMAFRPGQVDLPEENREAAANAITLPEVFHDFDSALPDFDAADYQHQLSLNQSRIDDITMKEEYVSRAADLGDEFGLDDFGGGEGGLGGFDDFDSGVEHAREGSVSFGGLGRLDGTRISDALDHVGPAMDLDAPIPDDDFGGEALDENIFGNGLFEDDDLMRAAEGLDGPADVDRTLTMLGQNGAANEESFALEPLEPSVLHGLEKHRTRRKRKLVVDEVRNITGEEMKAQMNDDTDVCMERHSDLAPPTKKFVAVKEFGHADRLFGLPAIQIRLAKDLHTLYTAHLVPHCREEEKTTKEDVIGELELSRNAEELEAAPTVADSASPVLSAIPEEGGGGEHHLPDGMEDHPVPSVSPVGGPDDDLGSPPPEKEKKKRRSTKSSQELRDDSIDDAEADETVGDKRWTKRTQHILENISSRLESQDEVTFSDISKGATRKSAAQKFYTLLALKKFEAIDLQQDEPYGEIVILKGPKMEQHVH